MNAPTMNTRPPPPSLSLSLSMIFLHFKHIHECLQTLQCLNVYAFIFILYNRQYQWGLFKWNTAIEILYIEGTSGPWACPSSRQREKMSRTHPLCPIVHAACPARQRRMVQFIGSLTLEPAGYHGRAHLQRRLYLVPSMYNISMNTAPRALFCSTPW